MGQRHFKYLLSRCCIVVLISVTSMGCTSKSLNSATTSIEEAALEDAATVTLAAGKSAGATSTNASLATPTQSTQSAPDPLTKAADYAVNEVQTTHLSAARLDFIAAELGNSEQLLREQSFAVKLPNVGVVDFVPSKVQDQSGSCKLALRWRSIDGSYVPLYLSERWHFDALSAVAFEDIDRDGLGPDVVAIAQYTNPTRSDVSASDVSASESTQPFSRAIVLFNDGNNQFGIDSATDNLLANSNVTTIEAARSLLKDSLQGTAGRVAEIGDGVAEIGDGTAQDSGSALALQDLTAGTYARIKANGQFCTGFVCEPSQRRYPLADAQLTSSSTDERLEITLKPDTPISEKDAIAYGTMLSGSANVVFDNPITEKAGNVTLRKTYLPPSSTKNSVSHASYSVRLEMTAQGEVSEITFHTVLL